ncbi:MOSC domain-containing protein [Luteimonas deserti]|uniref:MOSC domain-containing protein n=1 Tax=Luteimonas deserti TaxID=2752306 RepID=A0A7Z0QPN9_9GAMM|nr:MOSC domain-containing protein [Luteimonas deserti]NYZ61547.1 MOSC domain-containing protein [Luteimonas deserti]
MSLPAPTPLLAVLRGAVRPYTRPGTFSAIDKRPAPGVVQVTVTGLVGDAQGDLRVHGGVDKAVHHYPYDHYPAWRSALPGRILLDGPGAFGENLSTLGWTEDTVCLGDVVQVGSAEFEVSQARQPCWKLDDRFDAPRVAARVQATGRTGWYYRVRRPGEISAGDPMRIVARPYPEWPLRRLLELLFQRTLDRPLLEAAATLPLPAGWLKLVHARLRTASVESWAQRLDGPAGADDAG